MTYQPEQDPMFQQPYIDREEPRERAGIPFSWVHGGFHGTDVRFSFCFPAQEAYEGRFYQFLSPAPGPEEELASLSPNRQGIEDQVRFALSHGAYFVESNMGAGSAFGAQQDPTLLYHASAAVAEYSRQVALARYGGGRPFGYVYGGSGGGYKTCACIEMTTAFDGAVPYVTAAPVALPNVMCVGDYAGRMLRRCRDWLADAAEPGSTHDFRSGLNEEERAAFDEACAWGMPLETWAMGTGEMEEGGSYQIIGSIVRMTDPGYFHDFWTLPGYAGSEPGGAAARDRVQVEAAVADVCLPQAGRAAQEDRNRAGDAWQKLLAQFGDTLPMVRLAALDLSGCNWPRGLTLRVLSGAAAGRELRVRRCEGAAVLLSPGVGNQVADTLALLQPGDRVLLDNGDAIALQYYHRHQLPERGYPAWDCHRNADGSPKYPQRKPLLWESFARQASGAMQTGQIQGKVIMVNCMADGGAATWMADWYRQQVQAALGAHAEDWFCLWCMEHCGHMDSASRAEDLHTPGYLGALYRALLELPQWVERGIRPSAGTRYRMENGLPTVPAGAAARGGVQPVLTLLADGYVRDEIRAGDTVAFTLRVEHPHPADRTVRIEWSFDGEPFAAGGPAAFHRYDAPGTHFAAVRVTANRSDDLFTAIENIARARIVVEA